MSAESFNIETIGTADLEDTVKVRNSLREFKFAVWGSEVTILGFSLGHAFKRLRGMTDGTVLIRPIIEGAAT